MGAGTGYWGRLLQLRGVDIVCYDLHTADDDEENDEEKEEDADQSDEADEQQQEGEEDADEEEEEGEQVDEDDEEQESEEDAEESDDEEEEVEVEQIYWMDVLKGTPKVKCTPSAKPFQLVVLTNELLLSIRIFASTRIAHSSCATRTTSRTVRSPWRFRVCAITRAIRSSTSASCWGRPFAYLAHGANLYWLSSWRGHRANKRPFVVIQGSHFVAGVPSASCVGLSQGSAGAAPFLALQYRHADSVEAHQDIHHGQLDLRVHSCTRASGSGRSLSQHSLPY